MIHMPISYFAGMLIGVGILFGILACWTYSLGRKQGRVDPRWLRLTYTTHGPIRIYAAQFVLRHNQPMFLCSAEGDLIGPGGECWHVPAIIVSLADKTAENSLPADLKQISYEG